MTLHILILSLAGAAFWLYSQRLEVIGEARGIAKFASLICSGSAILFTVIRFCGWLYISLTT